MASSIADNPVPALGGETVELLNFEAIAWPHEEYRYLRESIYELLAEFIQPNSTASAQSVTTAVVKLIGVQYTWENVLDKANMVFPGLREKALCKRHISHSLSWCMEEVDWAIERKLEGGYSPATIPSTPLDTVLDQYHRQKVIQTEVELIVCCIAEQLQLQNSPGAGLLGEFVHYFRIALASGPTSTHAPSSIFHLSCSTAREILEVRTLPCTPEV